VTVDNLEIRTVWDYYAPLCLVKYSPYEKMFQILYILMCCTVVFCRNFILLWSLRKSINIDSKLIWRTR